LDQEKQFGWTGLSILLDCRMLEAEALA